MTLLATRHCNTCDSDLSTGDFSRWAISRNHKLCRVCSYAKSKESLALRKSSLERRLLARLRSTMHKQGVSRGITYKLALSTMRGLLAHFGTRSVLSGVQGRLTVVRWDRSRPTAFDNVVLMTEAEAREHGRRRVTDYHPPFAEHIANRLRAFTGGDDPPLDESDMYPPVSSRTKGFSPEAAVWHAKRFGSVHPAIKARGSVVVLVT